MKISALQEYGLRCALQLAGHKGTAPLTVREIAKNESLTTVYMAKILVHLRRAGFVKSLRGVNGGYTLNRLPARIPVGEILASLGDVDLGKGLCARFTGTASRCTHFGNCGIRPVWAVLSQHIYGFLNQLNLEQLLQDEAVVSRSVGQIAQWPAHKTPPPS